LFTSYFKYLKENANANNGLIKGSIEISHFRGCLLCIKYFKNGKKTSKTFSNMELISQCLISNDVKTIEVVKYMMVVVTATTSKRWWWWW
jgi:hypothetical protein